MVIEARRASLLRIGRRPMSPETRAKISAALLGRPLWSAERKAAIGEASRQAWRDPETRAKLMAARRDPDVRARIAAKVATISKGQWQDPEYQTKRGRSSAENARQAPPTRYEQALKDVLEDAGIPHIFQYPIAGTAYIADFYLPNAGLLLECDGSGHTFAKSRERDARRDARLASFGYRIVRLSRYRIKRDPAAALKSALGA